MGVIVRIDRQQAGRDMWSAWRVHWKILPDLEPQEDLLSSEPTYLYCMLEDQLAIAAVFDLVSELAQLGNEVAARH
jgi:hypothetical protein